MLTTKQLEQAIRDVEGFRVRFLHPDGRKVRSDLGGWAEYGYDKAAAPRTTVAKWIELRVAHRFGEFEVEVLDCEGSPIHRRTLLGNVRKSYRGYNEVAGSKGGTVAEGRPRTTKQDPAEENDKARETSSDELTPTEDATVEDDLESLLKDAVQNPALVMKSTPRPSIEIDAYELPAPYDEGQHVEHIRRFVRDWVKANGFTGNATLWEHVAQSGNFHHYGTSQFIVECGFGANFLRDLEQKLGFRIGKGVRFAGEMTPQLGAWSAICHVERGIALQPLDACYWTKIAP